MQAGAPGVFAVVGAGKAQREHARELVPAGAQAAVDHRRSTAAYADALSGEKLDEARLQEAGAQRLRTAEQLRDAVQRALGRIHTLLEPRQREHLAYLIRTGAISL